MPQMSPIYYFVLLWIMFATILIFTSVNHLNFLSTTKKPSIIWSKIYLHWPF